MSKYNYSPMVTNDTDNDRYQCELLKIQQGAFLYLNEHPNKYDRVVKNMLSDERGQIEILQDLFYSDQNIDIIQKQLILYVYNATDKSFLINKQDKSHLKIVMDFIFLYYSRNLPVDITDQIREMNKHVVEEIAPRVIAEAQQYVGYLNDVYKPRVFPDRPLNLSTRGNKTLPSITDTFPRI